MSRAAIGVYIVLLAGGVALYFFTPDLAMGSWGAILSAAIIHGTAVGLNRHKAEQQERDLLRRFDNYRCPFCRYFVGAEAGQCPKCHRLITPEPC